LFFPIATSFTFYGSLEGSLTFQGY